MQTVARHDISLAAEDAGGTLLHVHQLEQTELAFFMILSSENWCARVDFGVARSR